MPDLPHLARLLAGLDAVSDPAAVFAALAAGAAEVTDTSAAVVLSRRDDDAFVVEAVCGETAHSVGDITVATTASLPLLQEERAFRLHPVHALGNVVAIVALVTAGGELSDDESAALDVLARHAGAHLARMWDAQVRDDLLDERAAAMTALRRTADSDVLTGVASRSALLRLLASMLDRRERVGVVYVDLDGFKAVNDRYGHAAGDRVLRTVASRLRESVRPSDVVGRIGGDEFVLVVREADGAMLRGITGRLGSAMVDPVDIGGASVIVRASVGIAVGDAGDTCATLLRAADADMYRHKRRHARRLMSIS